MIVGCKQDLERVELPFVEIEALVTIIKMINILLVITIKMMKIPLTHYHHQDDQHRPNPPGHQEEQNFDPPENLDPPDHQVSLDWECGYTECSSLDGTGVTGVFRFFIFSSFGKYVRNIWECLTMNVLIESQ